MRIKCRHIVLFIICITYINVHASNAADTNIAIIALNCTPYIDGVELTQSDSIEVYKRKSNALLAKAFYFKEAETNIFLLDSEVTEHEIYFRVFSINRNCYTTYVDFITDTARSIPDSLSITSFNAHSYNFEQKSREICYGEKSLNVETNLPDYSLNIALDSSWDAASNTEKDELNLISNGEYYYMVETKYCIQQSVLDKNNVFNFAVSTISRPNTSLPDTTFICEGDLYADVLKKRFGSINNYILKGLDRDSIINPYDEFTANSRQIIIETFEPYCTNYDKFVASIEQPAKIELAKQVLCDKVLVAKSQNINSPTDWENINTANLIEVTNSREVEFNYVSEHGCIQSMNEYVEFTPLKINNVDIDKTEASCWKDGAIEVSNIQLNRGNINRYEIINTLNNTRFDNINEVPEGEYLIKAYDAEDCPVEIDEPVVIHQKCLENHPVFSPDNDGVEDSYFIPHSGNVKIFDRNGVLVNDLETPAYWNGTDLSGNQVPMGNYVIITDTERVVNITIVR